MRYLLLRRSLGERIAARQAPPQQITPDRQEWQRNYVAQSRATTDIRSTTGKVGGSAITQERMNAMSPQERMAHLQKIAKAQPTVPHYHALPNGAVAWGYATAGSRPVKPGDKLIAYRGIEAKPTPLTVHSHLDTHLGQGMRVIHPDGIHEDMHGQPLHPMTLATKRPGILAKSLHRRQPIPPSPRMLTVNRMRATMGTPVTPPPDSAGLRAAMRQPLRGDRIVVVAPLTLGSNKFPPGIALTVRHIQDGGPELYDHRGNPAYALSAQDWGTLLGRDEIVPEGRRAVA